MAQKQTKKSTAGKRKKQPAAKKNQAKPIRREVGAVVCLLLAVFTVLACFHVRAALLDLLTSFCKGTIGSGFYILPFACLMGFLILLLHDGRPVALRVTCAFLLPVTIGALVQLVGGTSVTWGAGMLEALWDGGMDGTAGGAVSGLLALALSAVISRPGAVIVLLAALLLELITSLNMTLKGIIQAIQNRPKLEYAPPKREHADPAETIVNRVAEKHIEHAERRRARASEFDLPIDEPPLPVAEPAPQQREIVRPDEFIQKGRKQATPAESPVDLTDDLPAGLTGHGASAPAARPAASAEQPPRSELKARFDSLIAGQHPLPHQLPPLVLDEEPSKLSPLPEEPQDIQEEPAEEFPPLVVPQAMPQMPQPAANDEETAAAAQPQSAAVLPQQTLRQETQEKPIKKDNVQLEAAQIAAEIQAAPAVPEYRYPPVDLLHRSTSAAADGTQEMRQNAERLADTLQSFNIEANIINVTRGPSVTRYELELSRGTKLSKVTNLSDDIALALGASGVRIAAIPDKISVVGIEVPNKLVTTVFVRDVIDSDEFRRSKSKISFAVGKDISGSRIIGDIAKLPHMLIAGTTGSGKSVCMNSLIISLLYKSNPDEVKLIMVDPKMVELGIYNGIPHLLIPVVTDPKKAAGALQWAVTEMMRRYRLMADAGVRDMDSFNKVAAVSDEFEKMPQIVVVIDELADLMLVAAKEVEESICRVAQMGRASGIHLVIATQRPSADVITGLMKANIPSRIAFAVASAMESRIILDTAGAEKLVGKGDMLYAPLGQGKPKRVQGCFITDDEVQEVVTFVKQTNTADYSDEVMAEIEKKAAESGKGSGSSGTAAANAPAASGDEGDEMLPAAVDVILETGQASVSMLQRRLKLGYARAARIMDEMEEQGIVGGFEGSKPRQLLVTKEQWEAMKNGENPNPPVEEEIP